jgi:hypothetical protein
VDDLNERILRRPTDGLRALVLAVSGTFAGTTVVFIIALLGLTPHGLDGSLHAALISFAIALPLLVFSAALSYVRVASAFPYFVCPAGAVLLQNGVYDVLKHLDITAATAFLFTVLVCDVAFLRALAVVARRAKQHL